MKIDNKSLNIRKAAFFLSVDGLVILIAIGMPAGASEVEVKSVVPENNTTMLLQVPDVRQSANYSCGTSCFQAVVSYWEVKIWEKASLLSSSTLLSERLTARAPPPAAS
ncbi:hypothetical protein [Methanosarcina siciliae]|uniref:hypothetical protein n=1 Tax=Methanosarcina siciliae TaxID=38027 RepID=UPI001E35464F|nr:hypothetical protein [Methanosarcina siciliae]